MPGTPTLLAKSRARQASRRNATAMDETPHEGRGEGARAVAWTPGDRLASPVCVFVDRDGVINERIADGFVLRWADFVFRDDALEALRILRDASLPVVVISNQSCVGRGLLTLDGLEAIMRAMVDRLGGRGTPLAAWYCCPHAPGDGCDCRKPKPGMLRRAASELGIDLARSHMIGDTETDVAAGAAAGCATYRVERADDFTRIARRITAATSGA